MPATNTDIAKIFNEIADILEIDGANPFRVRAYRTAGRVVASLPRDVAGMVRAGEDLTRLEGIGRDLAEKITEIVETGSLEQRAELEKKTSSGLRELLRLEGIGPKRVKNLHQELGVASREDLREAARKGAVRGIKGFGKKTEQKILESLEQAEKNGQRIKLFEAEQQAGPLLEHLQTAKNVHSVTIAGSFRRRKETVGDLDILVTCGKDSDVMQRFVEYENIAKIVTKGAQRSTVVLESGLQVDAYILPRLSHGAALHYFTGSKGHNISIRKLGMAKGLKINEHGVFKGKRRIAGKTEEEVYRAVDLAYIEPELREDSGELEAARNNALPDLVRLNDLRGDLHCHTTATDGRNSLEDLAQAARELGYAYLAITDHSRRVAMAKGLDEQRLARQMEEIDRLNEQLEDITLLKGIEVDILKDGSLDLADSILRKLDLTVCSVHYTRNLSKKKQTERIIRAMDNPYFNILGHPTGRLINERPPYEVDLEQIMEAARDRGCCLELNANPDRLDLPDRYCKMAREMNVRIAISTDAHSRSDLNFMRFGVDQARRGWLEAKDVINARSLMELQKILRR